MQQVTLTIEAVEFKSNGTNARGPWTLRKIKATGFPATKWFSAFNMEPKVGETADFLVKDSKGKDGKTYYSIEGYANASSPTPSAGPSPEGKELTILLDIQKKVQALYKYTFPE